MSRFFSRLLLATVLSAGLAAPAAAQKAPPAKAKKARKGKKSKNNKSKKAPVKKAKSFDFEADEIDGSRINPDGTTIFGMRDRKKPSLIRYRAHFLPEILRSAEDL
ncbi:MAG: hypothetical protein KJO07_09485 [Deltaproteobacteria bacterium]|nr:hypothetical protein [Deltaproteobacteria bacterium]